MEKFLNGMENALNVTHTQNGSPAYATTKTELLDLFAEIGALRNSSDQQVKQKFINAFGEDRLLAMKMLFHARNVRGGLGERKVFRTIIKDLANYAPDVVRKNIDLIPVYGRWDDVFELFGTDVENEALELVIDQYAKDYVAMNAGKPVSLLTKWLPNHKSKNEVKRQQAMLIMKFFGINEKQYRKANAKFRKYTNVTERLMSDNDWGKIDLQAVASGSMHKHGNAIRRHVPEKFDDFLVKVETGEAKINSSTLFPYDLVRKIETGRWATSYKFDKIVEAQWKALPDYVNGDFNVLVVADTSASMSGLPMQTALGLAVYFAERNQGVWHNRFVTFSSKPSLVKLPEGSLYEKLNSFDSIVSNTNIDLVFKLVLDTAVANGLSQEDLPKSLLIISDMQFDQGSGQYDNGNKMRSIHDVQRERFARHGYELPSIVYWNVNASKTAFQATSDYKGVQLVSGSSPAIFKSVMDNLGKTPYDAMVETLNSSMYDSVRV